MAADRIMTEGTGFPRSGGSQALLPEFDHEMAILRDVLARVPEDRLSFQPHERSMTLGRLAGHLIDNLRWGILTLDRDAYDIAPPDEPADEPYEFTSRAEALAHFDVEVRRVRTALLTTTDAALQQVWTFKRGGRVVMTLPRAAALRRLLMNHVVHHRAQLGVYLRLLDVPVPPTYGPSADEQ